MYRVTVTSKNNESFDVFYDELEHADDLMFRLGEGRAFRWKQGVNKVLIPAREIKKVTIDETDW